MKFYMKYISHCENVAFGVEGLRVKFLPTGAKRLAKPYVVNPVSNFRKLGLTLSVMIS